jgi:hypothetical protein
MLSKLEKTHPIKRLVDGLQPATVAWQARQVLVQKLALAVNTKDWKEVVSVNHSISNHGFEPGARETVN